MHYLPEISEETLQHHLFNPDSGFLADIEKQNYERLGLDRALLIAADILIRQGRINGFSVLPPAYLPERDWNFNPETQQIIRPENSRIPRLSDEDLHPAGPFYPNPGARAIQGGLDGRPLLFDNRNFFASSALCAKTRLK